MSHLKKTRCASEKIYIIFTIYEEEAVLRYASQKLFKKIIFTYKATCFRLLPILCDEE